MRDEWLRTNREYSNRAREKGKPSKTVISWGRRFARFHGVSSGLVLDVGIGTGLYFGVPYEESEYGYYEREAIGVDPFLELPLDGGVRGVGEFLPFRDEVFHTVFCVSALNHMLDHRACIEEIFRVLKRGGRCFVGAESNRGIDPHHLWFPSTNELKKALSSPFEIKKFRFDFCMCMVELAKPVS